MEHGLPAGNEYPLESNKVSDEKGVKHGASVNVTVIVRASRYLVKT